MEWENQLPKSVKKNGEPEENPGKRGASSWRKLKKEKMESENRKSDETWARKSLILFSVLQWWIRAPSASFLSIAELVNEKEIQNENSFFCRNFTNRNKLKYLSTIIKFSDSIIVIFMDDYQCHSYKYITRYQMFVMDRI